MIINKQRPIKKINCFKLKQDNFYKKRLNEKKIKKKLGTKDNVK